MTHLTTLTSLAKNYSKKACLVLLGYFCLQGIVLAQNTGKEETTKESNYPNKAVKVVVPSQPGGGTDIMARILSQYLTAELGQSFYIENKAGGGTMIGINAVAKSAPDGYTLLMVPSTLVLNKVLYKNVSFDPIKDFSPISVAATVPNILIVNNKLPVQNLAEFIALAKKKDANLSYGSAGVGTSPHMSMELFKSMAGLNLQHIPYKGTSPAVIDLMGGQVAGIFTNALEATPLINSGKVRALATSGPKRLDSLPQIPTVAESGLPNYSSVQWYGLVAPADTPKVIIDKLNAALVKGLKTKAIREKLAQDGADVLGSSPQEFSQLIKDELEKWTRISKAAGIELE